MLPEATTPDLDVRGFLLERDARGWLGIRVEARPEMGAIQADWRSEAQRRRIAAGRRQLLARACGIGREPEWRILDATAGLGRDAVTLAALGATVTLCERHPMMFALLEDALARLQCTDPSLASRLQLAGGDALDVMQHQPGWDVIYLDPMYPHRGKQALPGKEMQVFRALTGSDPDADRLLAPARQHAGWRVVVKRPRNAPPLADTTALQTLRGTQARFDLYMPLPCAT
jgi:16S rRNA (guanine1516-N2)-methyltransferase